MNEEKLNAIITNLQSINSQLKKSKGPILVELIGTPKSGKTTLLNHVSTLFENNNIPLVKRQETAEYNPISDKSLEEYNIWMYSELLKNLSEDLSNPEPRIVIYDRGILDRLPWIDLSIKDGSIPPKDGATLKQFFNGELMKKYKPLAYGFITSPELSVQRKGKPGRLVNISNIKSFNSCMKNHENDFKKGSLKYTQILTDPYQGRLKDFITDFSQTLTTDINSRLLELTDHPDPDR